MTTGRDEPPPSPTRRPDPVGRRPARRLVRVPASWEHASLRRNVVVNWVATAANVGLSLVLIPVVVRALDKELYGVWSFLNGLAMYSSLLYLGLGASFMKYLSEARGRGDLAALSRLLGVALTMFAALGSVALCVAVAVSPFVPDFFAGSLSADAAWSARITTILLGVRIFVFFLTSAFSGFVAAQGRMDLVTVASAAGNVLRTAAAVLAVKLPDPLVALASVVVADAVFQLAAMAWLCRVVSPEVTVAPAWPTSLELARLYGFGLQAFFAQVSVMIISYTDTAVVGFMLGAHSVAYYSLPLQLVEYARLLVNGVTHALLPELSSARARGDVERVRDIYLRAARICVVAASFVNVHLVILGPAFLSLWVGVEFGAASPYVLLFLGLSAVAQALSTQLQVPFFQAMNVLRVAVVALLAEAVLNLGLSLWWAREMGIVGVALATAVPATVTLVVLPRYMQKKLGVSMREFATVAALPAVLVTATSASVLLLLGLSGPPASYVSMAGQVFCSALAATPVVLMTFPRQEWEPLLGLWRR